MAERVRPLQLRAVTERRPPRSTKAGSAHRGRTATRRIVKPVRGRYRRSKARARSPDPHRRQAGGRPTQRRASSNRPNASAAGLHVRHFRAFDLDGVAREFAVPEHWQATTRAAIGPAASGSGAPSPLENTAEPARARRAVDELLSPAASSPAWPNRNQPIRFDDAAVLVRLEVVDEPVMIDVSEHSPGDTARPRSGFLGPGAHRTRPRDVRDHGAPGHDPWARSPRRSGHWVGGSIVWSRAASAARRAGAVYSASSSAARCSSPAASASVSLTGSSTACRVWAMTPEG
jgi:hypothetical protein